jgi:hypothetical protein
MVLEAALLVPVVIVLLVGMVEIAKITYTYYSLRKVLYSVARYVGTQQAVNFCDDADATVANGKNWILTGSEDGSGDPVIRNLTPDKVQIRVERYNGVTQELDQCVCDSTGCDTANGGQAPDFIVVSIPNGYEYPIRIPHLPLDPILFRPQVRVPYGGT